MPTSIEAVLPQLFFGAQGEDAQIKILGTFSDGQILDVTESSNIAYTSSNPAVATVDSLAIVKAISPGTATVTAVYGPPAQSRRAIIPVIVRHPVFTMAPDSLDFGNQNVGTSSSQQMTLMNNTSAPLGIIAVSVDGDFSATDDCVSSSPLDVGVACTITVTFRPTLTGMRTSGVRVVNSVSVPVGFRVSGSSQ
jgi:hypothetical protein